MTTVAILMLQRSLLLLFVIILLIIPSSFAFHVTPVSLSQKKHFDRSSSSMTPTLRAGKEKNVGGGIDRKGALTGGLLGGYLFFELLAGAAKERDQNSDSNKVKRSKKR
mmetsp:Transcript_18110/g.20887  ORF Transcript_18110/g.20887 Transcript_18110/m.20887 type:complete len:109 (+) Transcript_18110:79-405(+)